jgi:hypothetical protein
MCSNLRLLAAACARIAIRFPASSLTHLSVQASSTGGCVKRDAGATSGGTVICFVVAGCARLFFFLASALVRLLIVAPVSVPLLILPTSYSSISCICARASPAYLDPLNLPTSYSSLLAGR